MSKRLLRQSLIWLVICSFVGQTAFAEGIPAPKTDLPVSSEVVPNPEIVPNNEVVPTKEVVPSQEVVPNKEVVPTKEVVPVTLKPQAKDTPIAINPFVGEIAVGVSLLVTYGPQILALAASIATLAAGVNTILKTGKQSAQLTQSVGGKLQAMLGMLLGPLSMSNGIAKENVEGISTQLLRTAKFVSNNLNAPAGQVVANIDSSLTMSKDLQNLAGRGKTISEQMKLMASQESVSLKSNVVAGGEVQLLRDGTIAVSNRLAKQADLSAGAFNQTLENTKMANATLGNVQGQILRAMSSADKPGDEVTLSELGLSNAEVGKQLISARKYMAMSKTALSEADKSTQGLHVELLKILGDIKKDLEQFASSQGVDPKQLQAIVKDQTRSGTTSGIAFSIEKGKDDFGKPAPKLQEEIRFMVDELAQMSDRSRKQLQTFEKQTSPAKTTEKTTEKIGSAGVSPQREVLFNKKVEMYKKLVQTMSIEPGNKNSISAAKAAFELADREYQESLLK